MVNRIDIWSLFNGELYKLGLSRYEFNIFLVSLALLILVDLLNFFKSESLSAFLANQNIWFRWLALLTLLLAVIIFGEYGPAFDAKQFIYFQF
jgi:hypothetical protein